VGLKSLKVIETGTIRKPEYGFLFVLHSNYGCILYQFRDKARYWSKILIFHTLLAFDALLWGPRQNIATPFGADKLGWCDYPTVKESFMICVTVSTEYRRVIDGQIDGPTPKM